MEEGAKVMGYTAETHTFLRHTVDYPPPGAGWELVFVVATSAGSSDRGGRDGIDRGHITSMSISSSVVGIWARARTDEDKERERSEYNRDHFGWYHQSDEEKRAYSDSWPWLKEWDRKKPAGGEG